MLLEFLAHADAGVGAGELDPGGLAVAAFLPQGHSDGAVVLVVLDGVAHNVHHQPLYVDRAADEIGVGQVDVVAEYADAAPGGLLFQHILQPGQQLDHVERPVFEHDLTGFQLAHVQNFIDELQQKARGVPDFAAALGLFGHIVGVVVANLHHAPDAVDGRADVMAHPLQELGLGNVGGLSLAGGLFQRFLVGFLLQELFLLIGVHRAAAHQFNQKNNEGVGNHYKDDVLGRCGKDGGLWQKGVDVVVEALLGVAEVAAGAHAGVTYIDHPVIDAALLDELQRCDLVGGKPQQAFIVGGNDFIAAGHGQRAVRSDMEAGNQMLVRQFVSVDILGGGVVERNNDAVGPLAG